MSEKENEEKKERVPFIKGERIDLVPMSKENAKLRYKWVNDQSVRIYSRNEVPHTLEEIKKWSERSQEGVKEHIGFELWHKKDQKTIGNGGLSRIDYIARKANAWMVIGEKDYWSEGLGTEAMKLILDYAFKEVNLHKVYAGIFEPNIGSWSCAQKLGFKLEGRLKNAIYVNGKYHDARKYAMFKKDWLRIQNSDM
ncbi:MAG: Spermidine N(1)-acetyltransferase [Promethearchaeota archaeon]|nr:MAG: Spermidine N(1)-acetyltransferase [Candidatus Lokiarchaeota archaeon]